MIAKAKHLYLHIPFCKTICAYCDFVRFVGNANDIKKYVRKLINDINTQCIGYKFKTIYVGGGTPNSLPNDLLAKILHTLNKYRANDCEFTIECNPEFLTIEQAITLKAYKVNRASIGAQTANNTILRKFHRQHTLKDVKQAISNLQKVGINNISIDLIYGFNGLTDNDIRQAIKFINIMHLSHVSWYALEVKSGSLLYKHKYKLHEEHIEHQLRLIIELMHKTGFHRYEVSSWCKNHKFESQHNKSYWLTHDWKAIGLGACGFENLTYYENTGNIKKWHPRKTKYSQADYYFQIMLMGLRLNKGLDLTISTYKKAYEYYKNKLKHVHIVNHHLVADNLNLLDNVLIELL